MKRDPENIIIRMPNWLGDFVMATPLLADIKKRWPQAKITAMAQHPLCDLLYGNPYVDELFSFKKQNPLDRREEHRDLLKRLRQGKYDLGILTTNSFSSAFLFWRGRVKKRIGFKNEGRSLFLTKALPFPRERGKEHLVITYKRLLAPLGIPLSETSPQLYVTDEEKKGVLELLQREGVPQKRRLIGINPTAAFGPAKCWPAERYRELTQRLLEDPNLFVVFFGDKSGIELIETICNDLPSRAINLAGRTSLRELIALISLCDLFLTNDSGPMHIAAALKTPLIALFGSTSDLVTGPYRHGRVLHKHVSCSPCYLRTCPIDFRCMKKIEVDEVYREIYSQLAK